MASPGSRKYRKPRRFLKCNVSTKETAVDRCVCLRSSGPPPLSYSEVREVVLQVPGRKRKGFYIFLNIPSMQRRMKSDGPGDEMKACIDWYLLNHPHPSWRGIITALDGAQETAIADSIRERAEPLEGEP